MHGSAKNIISAQKIPARNGGESFEVIAGPIAGGNLIIADHASNVIPAEFASLGMSQSQLQRHIAYDIGVEWMARALARDLNAPAVLSRFSRLLIDPNRGDDDPTLVMRLSDGAIVPGNAKISAKQVEDRMRRFSKPYHAAVAEALDQMQAADQVPAVISLHSFTPSMKGEDRPWHVTVLWDNDPRLPLPMLQSLRTDKSLIVGDNEPYDGAMVGSTTARHCISRGIPHILFEVRQDLIVTKAAAEAWALLLAKHLKPILAMPELRRIKDFGSRATGYKTQKIEVMT
jgi:predicted N-formylglutamate amidohydrolase